MKKIMVSLILLSFMVLFVVVSPASAAYTPEQQATLEGTRLSFQLGQAYQQAQQGQNIAGFNALVDQWNAWVAKNFGQDANLLMQKMTGPVDLSKPYMMGVNTTNNGIVHSIDGSGKYGPQYTTNDINLLPDWAIAAYRNSETGRLTGDGYLGGV
jgi:hypothetical protein